MTVAPLTIPEETPSLVQREEEEIDVTERR
jgi:hypothetical protein